MRKIFKGKNLLATLLALVMLLGSVPAVLAMENIFETPAEEIAAETQPEPAAADQAETAPEPDVTEGEPAEAEKEPEAEQAPEAAPEAEEAPAPEEAPAEAPEAEAVPAEEVPAETHTAVPETEEVPEAAGETIPEAADEKAPEAEEPREEAEEVPAASGADEGKDAQRAEEAEEAEKAEETDEAKETEEAEEASGGEELVEIGDDDAGSVSEELLDEFNNPETFETPDEGIVVDIEMLNSELRYGEEVTLAAKVSGVQMNYRIVWEASDGDARGWFTVGSGDKYTFTLTPDIADREYRAVLYSVD